MSINIHNAVNMLGNKDQENARLIKKVERLEKMIEQLEKQCFYWKKEFEAQVKDTDFMIGLKDRLKTRLERLEK